MSTEKSKFQVGDKVKDLGNPKNKYVVITKVTKINYHYMVFNVHERPWGNYSQIEYMEGSSWKLLTPLELALL